MKQQLLKLEGSPQRIHSAGLCLACHSYCQNDKTDLIINSLKKASVLWGHASLVQPLWTRNSESTVSDFLRRVAVECGDQSLVKQKLNYFLIKNIYTPGTLIIWVVFENNSFNKYDF